MKLYSKRISSLCKGASRVAVALPLLALPSMLSAQTLLHRYSFVSDASDSVGHANGTSVTGKDNSVPTYANGVSLPGSGGGFGQSAYVSFPQGILTNTASLTIEVWATQNSQNNWAELWDFANSTAQNFALIPYPLNNGNHMEVAVSPANNNQEVDSSYLTPTGSEEYMVFTFNTNNLVGNLYDDGNLIATHTYPNASYTPGTYGGAAGTTYNMLGNDIWGDPQFNGTIYEFRIWNGAVSERYVAAAAIAGSGTIVTNLTPTSAQLTAGNSVIVTGTEQASVTVTLASSGSTLLPATSDVTNWSSSNPNVLQVNSGGLIVGISPGTATISAKVGGFTATSDPITVTPQVLENRYSFATDATDSVSGQNGTLIDPNGGSAASISSGLYLPGNRNGGYGYSGYLALPAGILTETTSITVECWATQTQGNTWAELWDFGNNGNQNFGMIPFPANNGAKIEVAFTPNGGEEDLQTTTTYPNGSEEYTVVTYNNYSLQASIYTNGYVDAVTTLSSTNYMPGGIGGSGGTTENALGNDVYGDYQFGGVVYEFRIWNGALAPDYVAAAAAAGPTVVITNTVPQTLTIALASQSMIGSGTQQASAIANLLQVSGVNLTPSATNWASSNPSVLTVSSSGLITAVNGGTATVSATVNGVTATSPTITVASTPPSFGSEPVANQTVAVGDNVTLSATALGGSLSYQWSFGATPISGATNSILVLTNIGLNQSGVYTLTVSNSKGTTNLTANVHVVQAILLHRYSFATDATDSVGGANGTLITGNNGSTATIANGLQLPGNTGGGFGTSGYLSLPPALLTNTTSLTVEVWATQNSQNLWATIWDFADNGNINFEFCPYSNRTANEPIVAFTPNGGEDDLTQPYLYPVGTEQYTVVTVTASNLLASLYENGTNVASITLPNTSYLPCNIGGNGTVQDMLGNDTYGDDQFSGTIYEFRIWDGAVTPLFLSLSAAAGPGVVVTNTTPLTISVGVTNASILPGTTEQASATADFAQVAGVPVTADVTNWLSSNTNVLTVSSSGVITAVNTGTATITATMGGTSGTSATITVPTSAPFITMEPATNVTLLVGGTLDEDLTVGGTTPLTFSWYFDNGATPISTSSSAALTIPNVQLGNAGTYTAVIHNAYGSVTSAPVVVNVVAADPYAAALLKLGALAYWPLDEQDGTTAYDVIGGYNGTYVGGCYLAQPGPTNSFFDSETSVLFDGTSGYVDIPEGPFNITGAITVITWVNVAAENGFVNVVGHGDTSYRISLNGAQPGANDGAPPADATDPSNIYDQNWHMLAYTYNGNTNQPNNGVLYVDGAPAAYNSVAVTPAGNNLDLWIGGAPDYGTGGGKRLADAYIADTAIFTEALTPAQIQGVYAAKAVVAPQTITITKSGTSVTLTWPAGTLLQATSLLGPWTTNSASSPYTVPATNSAEFYKLVQ